MEKEKTIQAFLGTIPIDLPVSTAKKVLNLQRIIREQAALKGDFKIIKKSYKVAPKKD